MIFLSAPAKNGRIGKARAVLETPSSVTQPSVSRRVVEYYSTPYAYNSIGCLLRRQA